MRKPFLCGNWKMNKTTDRAREFALAVKSVLGNRDDIEFGIAAPATSLWVLAAALRGTSLRVGAQNCHWEKSGAFTGELSAEMILETGATFVILGHSERRQFFGETDQTVNKRLHGALSGGLDAIVCVGELLTEREAGQTEAVVTRQMNAALEGISSEQAGRITIAYEPVWAIGTGRAADENDAQLVHSLIRRLLTASLGQSAAEGIRIQYGGSVTPDNIGRYMKQHDIDGGLVGGASLEPAKFIALAGF